MYREDQQQILLTTVTFLIVVQLFSALILFYETVDKHGSWNVKPTNVSIILTRFVCGIIFHIYL